MTKRILVTGATGFIGQHCLPALIKLGYEIHATYHHRVPPQINHVNWHQIDLLNNESGVSDLLSSVQIPNLLHIAWIVNHGIFWESELNFDFVRASMRLFQQFVECGGQRIVGVGTCAEYDWQFGYCVEDLTPCVPATTYGVCKYSLYQLLQRYALNKGISYAWGRVFSPFGEYESPERLIPYTISNLLNDNIVETTHGQQLRDFMWVGDVAEAFAKIVDSSVEGAINIGSGIPIKLETLLHIIASTLGKTDLLRIGAREPSPNDPPLLVADVRRLNNDIGWYPSKELDQSLSEIVSWWQTYLGAH